MDVDFWERFNSQSGVLLTIAGLLGLGATFGRLTASLSIWRLKSRIKELEQQINSSTVAQSDAFSQESDLWISAPDAIRRFSDYRERKQQFGLPVIAIGNLKGGVGKTTIAANLAAYLATRGRRVLALDLDWQGSLANIFNAMSEIDEVRSDIDQVFDENASGQLLAAIALSGGRLPQNLAYVPTYKPFGDRENRILVQWIRRELQFDAHFLLANVLYSREIKNRFDVVVLDTPPRMTAGMVNAMACATHLIIPTVFDEVSSEAAAAFIQQAEEFRQVYNSSLQCVGFVGSLAREGTRLSSEEARAKATLIERVNRLGFRGDELVCDRWVPRRTAISRVAGTNIAYLQNAEIRSIFDALFLELGMDNLQ